MADKESNPVGRPLKYKSADELQTVIDLYFLACKINSAGLDDGEKHPLLEEVDDESIKMLKPIEDRVPTVSGLAYTLGVSTECLRNYGTQEEYSATVKKARQRVEISLEQRLAGTAVTGAIFNLKNNFGWKDKTEQELTGKDGADLIPSVITTVYE